MCTSQGVDDSTHKSTAVGKSVCGLRQNAVEQTMLCIPNKNAFCECLLHIVLSLGGWASLGDSVVQFYTMILPAAVCPGAAETIIHYFWLVSVSWNSDRQNPRNFWPVKSSSDLLVIGPANSEELLTGQKFLGPFSDTNRPVKAFSKPAHVMHARVNGITCKSVNQHVDFGWLQQN